MRAKHKISPHQPKNFPLRCLKPKAPTGSHLKLLLCGHTWSHHCGQARPGRTDEARRGRSNDGTHGPSDAASDIQNSFTGFDVDEINGHLLVDVRGVEVGLAENGRGKVERLAPTPLIYVDDEIVERVDEVGDFIGGFDLFRAAKEGSSGCVGQTRPQLCGCAFAQCTMVEVWAVCRQMRWRCCRGIGVGQG